MAKKYFLQKSMAKSVANMRQKITKKLQKNYKKITKKLQKIIIFLPYLYCIKNIVKNIVKIY